jgi:predicted aspartyl protease
MYGAAAAEVANAHKLDPHDPNIRRQWLDTLSLPQRIANLEDYLASPTGDDPDDIKNLHRYLDFLKKSIAVPHKACRLVSDTETTTMPFASLLRDANHIRAYGLDVKLNDHNARLQIDTGAGGIVISRSVAKRAGIERFSDTETGGVGDQGRKASYVAYVDDIKIGALEFRDCEVQVIDQNNIVDLDGLIGMDVFSRFLVTLDYPARKLLLGPLPPRPDDVRPAKPTLQTTNSADDDSGVPAPAPDATTSAATKPAPRGPRDRYIAPEMKDWTRVYRVGHNLLLPASLNDTSIKLFILDTGAFATTVSPSVARAVTKVHNNSDITVKGISGKVDRVYSADSITFKFANLSQKVEDVVAFDTPQVSKSLGMDVSGFIGITALGQVTTTIDYRDGLIKFAYDANRNHQF